MVWHKALKSIHSPRQQAPVFGHGNEEEVHAPSVGLDTPKTKACKLSSVQGKANKRMENKRRKLDAGSSAIADAIKKISEGLKKMKMEMTKRIATQMLESEQIGRELIMQGQLHCLSRF